MVIAPSKGENMYISKVSLRNYRNFKNCKFEFNKGINTIIGENGAGKTNLFRAMRLLLDDDLLKFTNKLNENDFNRSLSAWKGHWLIISMEFSELSHDEAIQALFVHSMGMLTIADKASYNLFFRPKKEIRLQLSELDENDHDGLRNILDSLSINDYETVYTGKSTVDFNCDEEYRKLVGDFENVRFPNPNDLDESLYGVRIPHQLSMANEVAFTFIKALRDVVSDFNSHKMNPLLALLRSKSEEISQEELSEIIENIKTLNSNIENLSDVQQINRDIESTIKEAVGQAYAPSTLTIKSNLSEETNKLLQSLQLFISEPNETHEGAIHELSLGGANLIFLTLKLLEYKYQRQRNTFANFILIEEPEAHIHTHIQKTLFENLNYDNTQIIYSTHSTHISDVSKISNMNILAKKKNYVESYQPSNELSPEKIIKLERYLDAVRSNLLFAKGVILVEGDAEAILIPTLIKKVLGISLDELGISLINIGSTGFENVAEIFHNDRIRRKCAIITDLDSAIANMDIAQEDSDTDKAYKTKMQNSHKKGEERKVRLDAFVHENVWLKVFYAIHTFEVDFILNGNIEEAKKLCDEVYTDVSTIRDSKNAIESSNVAIYGKRILTMADNKGKGWLAIMLSNIVDINTKIPQYILEALLFVNPLQMKEVQVKIITHRIKQLNESAYISTLCGQLSSYLNDENNIGLQDIIDLLKSAIPDDQLISILERA